MTRALYSVRRRSPPVCQGKPGDARLGGDEESGGEDFDLTETTCCHTFRATGITAYLGNGGTMENAQAIAGHESPRTTKLYDHTPDAITLDEVERIGI